MTRQRWFALPLACMLMLAGACASSRSSASDDRATDRNTIDQSQIVPANQTDAYRVVLALHPEWLALRGSQNFGRAGKRVYLDEVLLGGVATLQQISSGTIQSIHNYDGPAATQRWGTGHAGGVIQVRTRNQ